jgi:lipopolysaccharide/colanic/teichoic acid biosynthesis glycosyltransferase
VPVVKRTFDIVFAAAALVFFAPFIGLVALAILLREGGPVFFLHERIGHGGRTFRCIKFRTMVKDADARLADLLETDADARAEWAATRKLRDDPRINCLGAFLRKTSLDELPQFWNVLRGEMSIVGPRPIVADEAAYYGGNFADYISVRPGITGAWQVSGRSDTTFAERVALDVDYVTRWSFARDLSIVVRTVGVLLSRRGAC